MNFEFLRCAGRFGIEAEVRDERTGDVRDHPGFRHAEGDVTNRSIANIELDRGIHAEGLLADGHYQAMAGIERRHDVFEIEIE